MGNGAEDLPALGEGGTVDITFHCATEPVSGGGGVECGDEDGCPTAEDLCTNDFCARIDGTPDSLGDGHVTYEWNEAKPGWDALGPGTGEIKCVTVLGIEYWQITYAYGGVSLVWRLPDVATPVRSVVGEPLTIHSASARPAPPAEAIPTELKPAPTKKLAHSGASPKMNWLSGVKLSGPL